ncbi:MAG: TIGR00266 family protein [Candidatus Dojkabacteria bacterium]
MEEPKKIQKSKFVDETDRDSKGISYNTIGTTLQALSVQLDKGEKINSEAGKMSWRTENIEMKTRGQGIRKMISRVFAAESLFINEFTCIDGTGIVTFSTDQAGKIIPVDLKEGKTGVVFQRGAYLCSELGVERSTVIVKRLSAGFFGGKGFILQKLTGTGKAHLIADGEVVMYELTDGEKMLIDQGNLVAFDESVDFDIQTVGGGVKNWLFGGEGIFLGSLKGPGKVWMQTRKITVSGSAIASTRTRRSSGASGNPLGCIIGLGITGLIFAFMLGLSVLAALAG